MWSLLPSILMGKQALLQLYLESSNSEKLLRLQHGLHLNHSIQNSIQTVERQVMLKKFIISSLGLRRDVVGGRRFEQQRGGKHSVGRSTWRQTTFDLFLRRCFTYLVFSWRLWPRWRESLHQTDRRFFQSDDSFPACIFTSNNCCWSFSWFPCPLLWTRRESQQFNLLIFISPFEPHLKGHYFMELRSHSTKKRHLSHNLNYLTMVSRSEEQPKKVDKAENGAQANKTRLQRNEVQQWVVNNLHMKCFHFAHRLCHLSLFGIIGGTRAAEICRDCCKWCEQHQTYRVAHLVYLIR